MIWSADTGIALDHEAEVPLGVQLDWAIRAAVSAGRLRPGERLPALRDLAAELGVNHNTLRAAVASARGLRPASAARRTTSSTSGAWR